LLMVQHSREPSVVRSAAMPTRLTVLEAVDLGL
jgi:hypothetical protein